MFKSIMRPLPGLLALTGTLLVACSDDPTGTGDLAGGDVSAEVTTVGAEQDADGYTLVIDADTAAAPAVAINDTVLVTDLSEGDHTFELTGVQVNCAVAGDNPRTVTVTASEAVVAAFEVSCVAALFDKIIWASSRDGDFELFVANTDGSDAMPLTSDAAANVTVAVSPDGTKIAFGSDRDGDFDIYVMNADGTGVIQLTDAADTDSDPDWSPDGSQIAFSSHRDGDWEIYVMNADGTAPTNVTNEPTATDIQPRWSPDGSSIAFQTDRDGDLDAYTMNPDGSAVTNRTSESDSADILPAWSPDGTQLVIASDRTPGETDFDLFTMNVDGTGATNITNSTAGNVGWPDWSPDGGSILFVTRRDGNNEIYAIASDGTGGLTNLTNDDASDHFPRWTPARH